jgi:hypothetical protein
MPTPHTLILTLCILIPPLLSGCHLNSKTGENDQPLNTHAQSHNLLKHIARALPRNNYKITVWSGGTAVKEYLITDSPIYIYKNGNFLFVQNQKIFAIAGTITAEPQ